MNLKEEPRSKIFESPGVISEEFYEDTCAACVKSMHLIDEQIEALENKYGYHPGVYNTVMRLVIGTIVTRVGIDFPNWEEIAHGIFNEIIDGLARSARNPDGTLVGTPDPWPPTND
jgi:hypothetical protein